MAGWTEGGILTAAAAAGMIISIPICWALDCLANRIAQIREQRRTLACLRPRKTAELEARHSRARC